ncbi:hypothetical protein H9P43_000655 [Blastocladiella emersonii ATCC 22665]|nr:hypothetical protein H9P43_000655 [Blastocladiella emersonii ATCC 22665]
MKPLSLTSLIAVLWLTLAASPAAAGPWPAETTANGFRGVAVTYMSRLKLLTVYGGETVPVGAAANATGRALPTVFSLDLSKPFDLAASGLEPAIVTMQPSLGATGVANLVPLMYQSSPNDPYRVLLAGGNSAAGVPNTQVFEYEFPATASDPAAVQAKLTTGSKNASLPLYPARVAVLSDTVPGAMGRTATVMGGLARNQTGGFTTTNLDLNFNLNKTSPVATIDDTGVVTTTTEPNPIPSMSRAIDSASATLLWSARESPELKLRLTEASGQLMSYDPATRVRRNQPLARGDLGFIGRDPAAVTYVGANGERYDIFLGGGGRGGRALITYVRANTSTAFTGVVRNPDMGPLAVESPAAVVLGNTIVVVGGINVQPASWPRKVINLLKIESMADGTLAFRWVDKLDPTNFTAPATVEPLTIIKPADRDVSVESTSSGPSSMVAVALAVAGIACFVGLLSYAGHRSRERFLNNGGSVTIAMRDRTAA